MGWAPVQVTTATGGQSNEGEALLDWAAPTLFTYSTASGRHAIGYRADGLSLAAAGAKPGETVMLLGTGFGATSPPTPVGQIVPSTPLAQAVTARMGGLAATVRWAGLVAPGLYQVNVVVPEAPNGVHKVLLEMAGKTTQADVLLSVRR